jgi:putative transposase
MSIPVRNAEPSHVVASYRTFFVTSSTWGKRTLLQSDRAARLLIDVLYHYRKEDKYLLHEFVIMPDHFHLLVTVGAEMTVEKAVQFIKGGFAFRAGRDLGFRAPVWQKGSGIRAYIKSNPVKRFLAQAPADYSYSSAHPGFELDALPQRPKPLLESAALIRTSTYVLSYSQAESNYPYSSAQPGFELDDLPQRLKPPFERSACGIAKAMP